MSHQCETNPHFFSEEQPLRPPPHGPKPKPPGLFHGETSPETPKEQTRPPAVGQLPPRQPPPPHRPPPPPQLLKERPSSQQNQGGLLRVPPPRKTKPITWFTAVFCAALWTVVILGGLIILIVYLMFRPRSPKFDVSGATLNAAYLDMGYLLNSDLTLLANFSNMNKKVSVDFNFVVINLYYESTLVATRSIYPFSASRMDTVLQTAHMVSSQVPMKLEQTLNLTKQMERDRVSFTVKGVFRVRSNLGGLLRYTYWLYAKCNILMSRPPSGVLLAKRCKTKR